ncbi:MAG: class I SAM-dependent methyltransferase [Elusimicrobiota bacterium]
MQFDFGQNWENFSKEKLTQESIKQAREHFKALIEGCNIKGKRFIDIGFGQGLSLIFAQEAGAEVTGIDINPKCNDVFKRNMALFKIEKLPKTLTGSILDDIFIKRLKIKSYDIVHSWGVLHHTGDMYRAIDNACSLVAPNGVLIIAIYNKHWTSPIWKLIKYFYNISPVLIKKMLIYFFYPIIFCAKFVATGKNPLRMTRGMDFFYNVVDWIGGYPYEYAFQKQITDNLKEKGFKRVKFVPARLPTGCNEYVFIKE